MSPWAMVDARAEWKSSIVAGGGLEEEIEVDVDVEVEDEDEDEDGGVGVRSASVMAATAEGGSTDCGEKGVA